MTLVERVLLALSRPTADTDYADTCEEVTLAGALASLRRDFSDLDTLIAARRVLDFGCGSGRQSVALVVAGAGEVVGVDINARALRDAELLAARTAACAGRIRFATQLGPDEYGSFDVVISKDSMEHFADPAAIMREVERLLRPGGLFLVTFGPPWYAPYGSHMHFFTRVPWVNLLFRERTVMRVRARYRTDGAMRYEDVESGLNRMSVGRFERLARSCGMELHRTNHIAVKNLRLLAQLPWLRELFINQVIAVLRKPLTS